MSKSFYHFVVSGMNKFNIIPIFLLIICSFLMGQKTRPRDMGLEIGLFNTGKWNAITDVAGVTVGHETIIENDSVRTGVTVIIPHQGGLYKEKVMAAVHVTNGYGKAVGFTQIEELGTIETPIALTNTLNTFLVANAIVDYMISENPDIRSVNPVVGETNDSGLNDIRGRHVTKKMFFQRFKMLKAVRWQKGRSVLGRVQEPLDLKAASAPLLASFQMMLGDIRWVCWARPILGALS
jgi:D-aminopeptidase